MVFSTLMIAIKKLLLACKSQTIKLAYMDRKALNRFYLLKSSFYIILKIY